MVYPCAHPRCPAVVERGGDRCPVHRRTFEQRRRTSSERGYTSQWTTRAALFRQRYPFCGMRPGNRAPVMSRCHEAGRLTVAEQVDHVVPHKGDPMLFWDEETNWQSLCNECGGRKSGSGL
jgi:5-methylcytosine-specific restriction enzyme A